MKLVHVLYSPGLYSSALFSCLPLRIQPILILLYFKFVSFLAPCNLVMTHGCISILHICLHNPRILELEDTMKKQLVQFPPFRQTHVKKVQETYSISSLYLFTPS